jgi:hypothetical protein
LPARSLSLIEPVVMPPDAHAASDEDRAFRAAFEACAVQPAAFNHEAHLRLAYVYLVEYGTSKAHERMRQSLLSFLEAHGVPPEKYHETLTRAWVLAVSHFMDKAPSSSFAEFAANSQPLLNSKAMLTHYTPEKLFSPEARTSYVEPDLEAIPKPVKDQRVG